MSSNWAEPKLSLGGLHTSNSVHHRHPSDTERSLDQREVESLVSTANNETRPRKHTTTPTNTPREIPSETTKQNDPPVGQAVASEPGCVDRSPLANSNLSYRGNRLTSVHIEGDSAIVQHNSRVRISAGQLLPGTRYRILRWIGEGNMGVVYEAEHIDIERQVALKILNADFSRIPAVAQVFREEARASARIGATNIIDIVDFAELAGGRLMYAMEFIKGRTLHSLLEEGPIDPARLIGILRQVCKGLSAAHQAGIVHRDIKPENIMLCNRNGRSDSVKILDFGISAMLEQKGSLEQLGGIVGTPFYMAPEQILSKPFDGRLDMYAVGCTAYELLTGRPPFLDENLMTIFKSHISAPPPPPSTLVTQNSIPSALESVILRCLRKEPEERFQNMNDLEGALCESQIASKLCTPWDDLALPDLDPDRRDKILAGMPDIMYSARKPNHRKWILAIGVATCLVGATWIGTSFRKDPPAINETEEQIHELVRSARNAAARSFFVYPPADDPNLPTAYNQVLQLDRIALEGNQLAKENSEILRDEFANTLIRLGDDYWERDGGQAFAIDYYAMALVFSPNHARAKERALYTPGELATLRDKAEKNSFTQTELIAAEPLFVLAQPESNQIVQNLGRLKLSANSQRSLRTRASLEKLLRQAVNDSATLTQNPVANEIAKAPTTPSENNLSSTETSDDLQLFENNEESPVTTEGSDQNAESTYATEDLASPISPEQYGDQNQEQPLKKNKRRRSSKKSKSSLSDRPRNPKLAADYVAQAKKAHRSGKMSQAESLYHQALGEDSQHLPAIAGLGDIYFDLAKYSKAVQFRQKMVNHSPKNGTYRRRLGDAYFKVLRYADALEQYRQAQKLGDSQVESRIDKLERFVRKP